VAAVFSRRSARYEALSFAATYSPATAETGQYGLSLRRGSMLRRRGGRCARRVYTRATAVSVMRGGEVKRQTNFVWYALECSRRKAALRRLYARQKRILSSSCCLPPSFAEPVTAAASRHCHIVWHCLSRNDGGRSSAPCALLLTYNEEAQYMAFVALFEFTRRYRLPLPPCPAFVRVVQRRAF